jgi:acyl-coenzyme A thioesterase PaaI-like protein
MEPRPVSRSHAVLVHSLVPTDANTAGFVHGGVIMKLCDQVAGIAGVRHSGGRVVTAGMDRMTFNEPIEIGELLTLRAAVNAPVSPGGLATGFASGERRWRSACAWRPNGRPSGSLATPTRPS